MSDIEKAAREWLEAHNLALVYGPNGAHARYVEVQSLASLIREQVEKACLGFDAQVQASNEAERATMKQIDEMYARISELEKVARMAAEVIPYVTATIDPCGGNIFRTRPEWVEVHEGRAMSSTQQLKMILEAALFALSEPSPSPSPSPSPPGSEGRR